MNPTVTPPPAADPAADLEAVAAAAAAGRAPDPEVVRRVRDRAAQARRDLLAARGVQNIGVALIRELRGDLPA